MNFHGFLLHENPRRGDPIHIFPLALDIGFIQRQREEVQRMITEGRVDPTQANTLIEVLNRWETISRQAKELLIEEINKAQSIDASRFPEHLLEYSIRFPDVREMLISKIYFKPF